MNTNNSTRETWTGTFTLAHTITGQERRERLHRSFPTGTPIIKIDDRFRELIYVGVDDTWEIVDGDVEQTS